MLSIAERDECGDTLVPEARKGAKSAAGSQARSNVVTAAVELSQQGPTAPGVRFLAGKDLAYPHQARCCVALCVACARQARLWHNVKKEGGTPLP